MTYIKNVFLIIILLIFYIILILLICKMTEKNSEHFIGMFDLLSSGPFINTLDTTDTTDTTKDISSKKPLVLEQPIKKNNKHENTLLKKHIFIVTNESNGDSFRYRVYNKNMINYSFIISPFGHGFDCIRTFEALCLGCIVIMKKSFLDIIYEELPVLLVDEWTDINKELLDKTLIEFSIKTFNYEKLKMKYWIDIVMSQFDNIE